MQRNTSERIRREKIVTAGVMATGLSLGGLIFFTGPIILYNRKKIAELRQQESVEKFLNPGR